MAKNQNLDSLARPGDSKRFTFSHLLARKHHRRLDAIGQPRSRSVVEHNWTGNRPTLWQAALAASTGSSAAGPASWGRLLPDAGRRRHQFAAG